MRPHPLLLTVLVSACELEITPPDTDTQPFGEDPVDLPDDCQLDAEPLDGSCDPLPLACGDHLLGSTAGGPTDLDAAAWSTLACSGSSEEPWTTLVGPEARYELDLPANTLADVTLDTSCGALALRAFRTETVCNLSPGNCSSPRVDSDAQTLVSLSGSTSGNRWEIVVDGDTVSGSPYVLSVDCTTL